MEQILQKARELAELLENSQIVIDQKAAKKEFDNDAALQEEVGSFNLAKLALMNESNKETPNAEKVAEYQNQTRASYEKIMQNPTMMKLNDAELKLQDVLTKINTIIQSAVTDEPEGGCTHDCSTCGGCH